MIKLISPNRLTEKQKKILSEISEDFNQYLLNGNLISFFKDDDSDLNINNIEKLLKIHFILTETNKKTKDIGVINFLEELPARIRRIKTSINPCIEIYDGIVKSKINWNNTIKQKLNRYPSGGTLFVCEIAEKKYNVPENLVLKEILRIIHEIAFKDINLFYSRKNGKENKIKNIAYLWLKKWVEYKGEKKRLLDVLEEIFHKNVYIKRIKLSPIKITDRVIFRTLKSRFPLYREAAILLKKFRELMNFEFDSKIAKELLKNTFIVPHRESVLFELYWVIKIIKAFKTSNPKNFKYELREPGQNLVASWTLDGFKYKIYHNSIGNFNFLISGEFLESLKYLKEKFKSEIDKKNFLNNFISREVKVYEKLYDILDKKFVWSGRPDIILEKYDENQKLISVLIGEVKDTSDKDYAINGLKQLIEYIALIKGAKDGRFIESFEDLFEALKYVKGILFTDMIKNFSIKEDKNLCVVMFGKENLELKDFLRKL